MKNKLGCWIVGLGTTLVAAVAGAEPAATAEHASVGALVGYATDDLNLGLGVRGGYTLPSNVYLGGTFVYHLGRSESVAGMEASAKLFYFGAEGGYDIPVSSVVIRPYLGLGAAKMTGSVSGGGVSMDVSETKFSAWPGATLIYPINSFFVGADARFLIVSDNNAFGAFATAGGLF
jgi:hypothetical protein